MEFKIPHKNIWLLCHHEDCEGGNCNCNDEIDDIHWCSDNVNDTDIEYISKAEYNQLRIELEAVKKQSDTFELRMFELCASGRSLAITLTKTRTDLADKQKQFDEAVKVIEYYGDEDTWGYGMQSRVYDQIKDDDIEMVVDNQGGISTSIAGGKARQFLATVTKQESHLDNKFPDVYLRSQNVIVSDDNYVEPDMSDFDFNDKQDNELSEQMEKDIVEGLEEMKSGDRKKFDTVDELFEELDDESHEK